MVAKASWLAVQPEINLRTYLADEESRSLPPSLDWLPDEWKTSEEDFEVRCGGDDDSESE